MEQDLHQFFGVDVGDPAILDGRSWRWMRTRIVGCLGARHSRTATHFAPPETKAQGGGARWR